MRGVSNKHCLLTFFILYDSKILIELCQFNGSIIKVKLFKQKGAGVMYTNAHSQYIL